MGVAIPVMHYTGMAAASFAPSSTTVDLTHAVSISMLGAAGIAAVTFIVLGLALLTSWMDRRFAAKSLELQEQRLQRSEAFLAEAQSISHTGSFSWRPSTGEIIWSDEAFRIFQYDRTTKPTVELILQRVHPEDRALVKEAIERASQDGNDFEHEYRLVMLDGAVRDVHVVAHAERNESGEREFVGAVMDVTGRKRAEEALRRSEGYLAEAQRLTHTGSWARSILTGELIHSSEEHSRLYGFDPDRKVPSREEFNQRIHSEDRPRVIELAARADREGKDFEAHFRIVLPDGTTNYVYEVAHPVFTPSGEVREFVGVVTDVSERKRAEEERERLREAQTELAHINRVSTMES